MGEKLEEFCRFLAGFVVLSRAFSPFGAASRARRWRPETLEKSNRGVSSCPGPLSGSRPAPERSAGLPCRVL